MAEPALHRYERDGRRYAVDPETCFCFECDAVSWDVLEHYPHTTLNRILHLLRDRHPEKEILEVAGELEWLRAAKSIFSVPKQEDYVKRFDIERGLKRLTVLCAGNTMEQAARRWFARRSYSSANCGGEGTDPERLLAAAARLGVTIRQIWITHAHIDHAGGSAELAARLGHPMPRTHAVYACVRLRARL